MPSRRSYLMVAMLSFIGGYIDTFGFIALFGLFTAHITGNFVLMGAMIVHPMHGGLLKFLAFPAFLLGVVISRVIVLDYEARQRSPLKILFALQAILLTGFMIAGSMAPYPLDSDRDVAAIIAGMLGAAAMAIQATGGRTVLTSIVHTSMMTGNVTHMFIDIVDIVYSKNEGLKRQACARLRQLAPAIAAFMLGAISAAFGYMKLSFWSLCLPIALLVVLTFRARQEAWQNRQDN
jgi:uncharacterized membrane protein YoaK (UPF0700 family)